MKIVVAGGNGFIGGHFVARAIARGHEVTVCARSPRDRLDAPRPHAVITGGLEQLVDEFDRYADADVICHFASSTVPATSNADPARDITDNLVQTVRLLDAMRDSGCKRIVYLSSGGAVYGVPKYSPIDEDHPQNPISSYGIVKSAVERYLALYSASGGLSAAVVRPANPYGPGQNPAGQIGAVPVFLGAAREGRPITLYGDGSTVRDFVYIDDLTDLLTRIVESDVTGVFNCGGGGEGTSLADLIATVEAVTGRPLAVTRLPARAFDPPLIVLDNARASGLDWRPTVSLEEGVRRTWRAMQGEASQ
ncbi:NAD-dependent epimerase/dehydratase family protein [Brevundimonas goettingensis]|uniref:NAD-dependent epimerase/dehydratase family protein n=1 Tax=Brevundimonas goettingensis TaxID=2774190 RepID=A0A975C562_9CAUL|nr:NAD-dependent epimerase/dehydratase family protein [Brevundimonas goettingensis]QTC91476.1 NAD-dependent epimerase/dehydratase family protein [Brevundimonas goettingensis]